MSEHRANPIERLRARIGLLHIETVVEPHMRRSVRDRNRGDRPATLDAVLLDDLWRTLDEFEADVEAEGGF